jgi:C_GCAxxG_C_C family probable redox protein
MTNPVQIANVRFSQHYSCSQSVFSAFAPRFGLTDEQAIKLASPFGGGIAHQGHVCGAVTGALMAIGLARGKTDPKDKDAVYQVAQAFMQKFEEKHGTVLCRELIDYDMRVPEEYQAARDQKVFTTLCPNFVQSAVEIVVELLDGHN